MGSSGRLSKVAQRAGVSRFLPVLQLAILYTGTFLSFPTTITGDDGASTTLECNVGSILVG
jgi:hypothetical protein